MARGSKPDASEQSRSRRERILDAAFSTFAGHGYRDASMDDIASAAETSKGGVYFHFPTKESIFRELMRTTADKLVGKVERAVAEETDPIAQAETAIRTVLATFAGHRTMARLLFLDVIGAGRVFQAEANELHERFAALIGGYLDTAIEQGVIPPTDTRVTSIAWFGAINEVVGRWLQADQPGRLEDAFPALRATLLRSVGVPEARIAEVPAPSGPSSFPEAPR
ncbi:MAG: TetR/AcrR family transcriptional regulator [Candidatus Limnocylindria bacterium]